MATPTIHIVFFLSLFSSGYVEGMGLCEVARKFPSSNEKDKLMISAPVNFSDPMCPINMVHAQCSCNGTCDAPKNCSCNSTKTKKCVCPDGFLMKRDECVRRDQCGCFKKGAGVIPAFQTNINSDCSEKCTCRDDQLACNSTYKCSPKATCNVKDDVRKCYCNDGFTGNGETCGLYKDCYDAFEAGQKTNGIYTIFPLNWPGLPFNVSCDMATNVRGWTVIQRRVDGITNFYRNWQSYKNGFGALDGDFWVGNDKLHILTSQDIYKLRIDIITSENKTKFAEYASFRIEDEMNKYRLHVGDMSDGNVGNNDLAYTDGGVFSTHDQDNDGCSNYHCAKIHRGAWWYKNQFCGLCLCGSRCFGPKGIKGCCGTVSHTFCTDSNLNGDYNGDKGENIYSKSI